MQFKHPEILYALFLLVIPIIVHLFQLRRFKKEPFTNVRFLKEVDQQTRKSSKLKKWLTLFTRLFLLASLVIAFSGPFYSKQTKNNISQHTYIYLDNSYSMQAKGSEGELLRRAAQDILQATTDSKSVILLTNNNIYENLTPEELKNTLLSVEYFPSAVELETIIRRIQNQIKEKNSLNNIFLFSDFQSINLEKRLVIDSLNNYYMAASKPLRYSNVSIDSLFIADRTKEFISLKIILKKYGDIDDDISLTLYNDDVMAGHSSVNFDNKNEAIAKFTIANTPLIKGRMVIDDSNLLFDNILYFSINSPEKINVTIIGDKNEFLTRIYTNDEFNLTETMPNKIDFGSLNAQQLLILNELEDIPQILIKPFTDFISQGGSLVIIPSAKADLSSYNVFLQALGAGSFSGNYTNELSVTNIHNKHPLLEGVFEKAVTNFQYPAVKSSYLVGLRNASPILSYNNSTVFLASISHGNGTVYCFTASLDSENSNFKNSPLIVPIFYNMGLYSYHPSEPYYVIGNDAVIDVPVTVDQDEVVTISNENESFIPLQQVQSDRVRITTNDYPLKSGIYNITYNNKTIRPVAFNYNRVESNPAVANIHEIFQNAKNVSVSDTIKGAFEAFDDSSRSTSLSTYFLWLALFWMLVEIALLKFLKP